MKTKALQSAPLPEIPNDKRSPLEVPLPPPPSAPSTNLKLVIHKEPLTDFELNITGTIKTIKMLNIKMEDGRLAIMPCINGYMPQYYLLSNGRIGIKFNYKIPFAGHHQKMYKLNGFISYYTPPKARKARLAVR